MRWILIVLAGCASGAQPPRPVASPAVVPDDVRADAQAAAPMSPHHVTAVVPVAPLGALAHEPTRTATVTLGPAQIELGGSSLQPLGEATLDVDVLEARGSDIRVGIRLPHVRFAVWTSRDRMLAVLAREQRIGGVPAGPPYGDAAIEVVLHTNARVYRVGKRAGFTQVRYLERIEVEGWVPDDALTDIGDADRRVWSYPGTKPILVTAGTPIRDAVRWTGNVLATFRYSSTAGQIQTLDEGWSEVRYDDGAVHVHGFLNKRLPPVPFHGTPASEPPTPFSSTTSVPARTCLYAGDEVIGFIATDAPAIIEAGARPGWFAVTVDTPWGPVPFAAKGPTATNLETCGP